MRITQANAARAGAVLSTGVSLLAAFTFFAAATAGGYDWVARLGGTGWVFLLSMIITMPTLMPLVSDRAARKSP
jgi:hypothetical protein